MYTNYIYDFDSWSTEPDKMLLGSKGASLAEMLRLGLKVPEGFTITTKLCSIYYDTGGTLPQDFQHELFTALTRLEGKSGKKLSPQADDTPLLLSVRSGSSRSMPGMMDTILNLGMNDKVAEKFARITKNEQFALDTYARFIKAYGTLVIGMNSSIFTDVADIEKRVQEYKCVLEQHIGKAFPQDPEEQLLEAIKAVLNSWMSHRAVYYRRLHDIPESLGTAVNIQSMVFGNMCETSGTGVVFTRNPSTGNKEFYGEFLLNAQGEDIVSGSHTPHPIVKKEGAVSLKELMPSVFQELKESSIFLENHYHDMQDIEFTIEQGKLYILQTRPAKRTSAAAIKIAVDMFEDGVISEDEMLLKIEPESLNQLLHASIDRSKNPIAITKGLPASPGAASGIIVFTPHDAEELSAHNNVILVRNETSPEDIQGMHVSTGVLTARGGLTSHAAVVARGMGTPCVCGAQDIKVDAIREVLTIGALEIKKGEHITIDGSTGEVFVGLLDTTMPEFSREFDILMSVADRRRRLKVRANADTAQDSTMALKLGAEGIGLCRTEHMFFEPEKILLMREMVISFDAQERQRVLDKLLPLHTKDFENILRVMTGCPVNIRLLDPPLHEFLPHEGKDVKAFAQSIGLPLSAVQQRLKRLHEVNPMLGHRGARLGITCPQIYAMQVEAIFTAAANIQESEGITSHLEIMLPLIMHEAELLQLKELVQNVIDATQDKRAVNFKYTIGTMIELPIAALQAGVLSPMVDYFSFGTNDLTQTTYGISRDDCASFIPEYIAQRIMHYDPFMTLDQEGVGELIKIAVERGKRENNLLKIGVCGEHGGDPESIRFFNKLGFDYVSCSPYRIPIARLAAARAEIVLQDNKVI